MTQRTLGRLFSCGLETTFRDACGRSRVSARLFRPRSAKERTFLLLAEQTVPSPSPRRNHPAPNSETLGKKPRWLAVAHHSQLPAADCSKNPRAYEKRVNKHTHRGVRCGNSAQKETIRRRAARLSSSPATPRWLRNQNSLHTRPQSAPISGFSPQSGLALGPVMLVLLSGLPGTA